MFSKIIRYINKKMIQNIKKSFKKYLYIIFQKKSFFYLIYIEKNKIKVFAIIL